MKLPKTFLFSFTIAIFATQVFTEPAKALPDPAGQSANMSKPVQVFIIMGQSNTLEMGKVKGDKEGFWSMR